MTRGNLSSGRRSDFCHWSFYVTVIGRSDQDINKSAHGGLTAVFVIIPHQAYNELMAWQVELTDQFKEWWDTLTDSQQEDLAATVELLMEYGPTLPYPHSSGIAGSRHRRMRELRTQSGGEPLRTFYALDPIRVSILLLGGVKTGNNRFYEQYVPIADNLYDEHLGELKQEGLIP